MKRRTRALATAMALAMTSQTLLSPVLADDAAETDTSLVYDGVVTVTNSNGLVLTYHKDSGVSIIEKDGYSFKDLDKDGELDVYEDWRESSTDRAKDLASKMDLDSMLGLMLHNEVKTESDIQDGKRYNLVRSYSSKTAMADGINNQEQLWAEKTTWGIPVVNSTDPRHSGTIDAGYDIDIGEDQDSLSLSQWPETMGMANTFDADTFTSFGNVLATEYRSLGFTELLGPQMDVITEPRWSRVTGAITEDYDMNSDMSAAYITAMQTTDSAIDDYGLDEGWGSDSVAAVAKHWPSGGNGENGYDSHKDLGKFGVYPGNGFEAAKNSFAAGAGLNEDNMLTSTTAAGIMPYYTISFNQDPSGNNVGNGFSDYLVTDLLRETYNYEGVVCTDWQITGSDTTDNQPYTSWGLEAGKGYTVAYRFYRIIVAGCDQIGGSGNLEKLKEGYDILANGSEEFGVTGVGEMLATERIRQSAVRILRSIINLGLFENPYTDPEVAESTAGSAELVNTAYQTHLDSIVMVKNSDSTLPEVSTTEEKLTAYTPVKKTESSAGGGWSFDFDFGGGVAPFASDDETTVTFSTNIDLSLIQKYYTVPDSLVTSVNDNVELTQEEKQAAADAADFAIVKIDSPDVDMGTSGTAQNLQYYPYLSTKSRTTSIGYDWYHADGTLVQWNETPDEEAGDYKSNRSINGMTGADDSGELELLYETIELMGDKPVIVILNMNNPTIVSEFESQVDSILIGTTVTDQAYLETISGKHEPSGLLAVTMPKDMDSVDASYEDVPDTTPYVDADGNTYSFGFGLNWSGRIMDERVAKYVDDSQIYRNDKEYIKQLETNVSDLETRLDETSKKDQEEISNLKASLQAAENKLAAAKFENKKVTITSAKSTKKGQATIKVKKVASSVKYQIKYAKTSRYTGAKTVTVTKTTATLKNLKSKKTYYVKVRALKKIGGTTVKTSYSKTKTVKVK